MKIAIIGATGMLGKPVARQLIAAGHDVILLGRSMEKVHSIFPNANFMRVDVFDRNTMMNAFIGVDAVYLNLSIDQASKEKDRQTEREGLDTILSAARDTGIRRIVYLSSLVHHYQGMNGFDWWAFKIKNEAVNKIKQSGIAYTIFYPSTFMETFPYQTMRGSKIAMMGKSLMPMWFIAGDDYAKQVARSFEILTNENREYSVQGPDAFTFDQATKEFIGNYSKAKLGVMKLPFGLAKFIGVFNQKLNYAWHICEALNKYPEKFESQQTWDELGKPVTRLADFAKSL